MVDDYGTLVLGQQVVGSYVSYLALNGVLESRLGKVEEGVLGSEVTVEVGQG